MFVIRMLYLKIKVEHFDIFSNLIVISIVPVVKPSGKETIAEAIKSFVHTVKLKFLMNFSLYSGQEI